MTTSPVLVWLRRDLRIEDHPAFFEASRRGGPVLPVFIWSPEEDAAWPLGAAARYWLHLSLQALADELKERGSRLILRRGPALQALTELAHETGAGAVYWHRRYEPDAIAADTRVKAALRAQGLEVKSFNGSLLFEPWEITTGSGGPYKVFTPFWKACLARAEPDEPTPTPSLTAPAQWPASEALDELALTPAIDWTGGIRAQWQPGPAGAAAQLKRFLARALLDYDNARNLPDREGTSRLSPYLQVGAISPRQAWHAVRDAGVQPRGGGVHPAALAYLRELGWREFAYHLLYHFPATPEQPLRAAFVRFPWRDDPAALRAWQQGRTGYPLVDAGMRELWATGWMHNRVRMVVASFLTKHLLLPWQAGARWFWDTLIDADLANNTLGWQWTAGCGADAAPYYRIFNPVAQGIRFDPHGTYTRRWVPELAQLPDKWLHQPWSAPTPPAGYPAPIVEHSAARARALDAYASVQAEAAMECG